MPPDRIDSAEAAGRYLEGLINFERAPSFAGARLGLEAIEELLARLGHPERALSVVHVAGSKGKGSTSLLAEALLGELGERVGTFTSPHLERWTERFRLDGAEVEGDRLAAAVECIRPHVEAMRAGDGPAPTFFDATTAAALVLFGEAELDRVVLEVGLGGRLDSTNAVRPAICCITSIELEHTEKLGSTLAAIAFEKAGILKPGVPAVIGRLPEEAMAVVEERARQLSVPLSVAGRDFLVEDRSACGPGRSADPLRGSDFHYHEPASGLELVGRIATPGRHQVENAGLAIALVSRLGEHGPAELARAAARAFAHRPLPGRIEVHGSDPWVVVDSAHTARSARALRSTLEQVPAERVHLLLSVSAGKDLDALLRELLPRASVVTLTRADPLRSLDPREVAAAVRARRPELEPVECEDVGEAVDGALRALAPGELLCITGSMYLAGIARGVVARARLTRGPDPG